MADSSQVSWDECDALNKHIESYFLHYSDSFLTEIQLKTHKIKVGQIPFLE